MSRRRFLLILLAGAVVRPPAAVAQQPGRVYRIAIVSYPTAPPTVRTPPWLEAFIHELRGFGWTEGRNITIVRRSVERERIDELATQIARDGFDVVVAIATPMARAMRNATATVPIVMAVASDPIGGGVADSLARPGGNVTGLSLVGPELAGKRLEFLRELVPGLSRVALALPAARRNEPIVAEYIEQYQTAARVLRLHFQIVEVATAEGWDAAFERLRDEGVGAVAVPEGRTLQTQASKIAAAAIRHRLASVHALRQDVEAGGLISYGADIVELWRRSATYVDKILRGTKPGELPIEQPTKFELVINLKTAKALGLTIPPSLLLRADQVIE